MSSSNLTLLVAGTAGALLLSTPTLASVMEEPSGGVERLESSRERRVGRSKGTIQLAAKKKKKKRKASGKHPAAGAPDEEDSGAEEATPSGGASDQEVQRAARVAPGADTGDDSASSAKSKKSAVKIEDEGAKEHAPEGPRPRYLDVALGGGAFLRSLAYHQLGAGTADVREYQPKPLAAARLALSWYPGAQFSSGFITNLGLDVNVEQGIGITSKAPDGTTFPTQEHDYNGGVKLRIPFEGFEPSVTVGYGDHAFKITGANRPPIPNTDYKYVRAVVGVRVALPGNLSLTAGGGYRHILSPGDIKTTYFPALTVAGIEANAGLGYAITPAIEARAGVDVRRYFYSMHSKNGDTYLAGGAVDQTFAFSLSVAVMLGGTDQPHAAAVTEEAGAPPPDPDAQSVKRKRAKRPTTASDSAPGAAE